MSEVLSARSVDRPTAVDLVKIAVVSGLKFLSLLSRKLAAFVFDNESSLLDRRCRKKAKARAGTADAESSLAGHIRQYDDSRPRNHIGAGARLISQPPMPEDLMPLPVMMRMYSQMAP